MRGSISEKQRLQHILKAIQELESFIEGLSFDGFMLNLIIQKACARNLEIIGEASNHLSLGLKQANNTVDWQKIKSFRNVLVHEYFKVNNQLVWQIMRTELPDLKQEIQKILTELSK